MSEVRTAPVTPKPIFVEGFWDDPYPIYRRFLEEGEIHSIVFPGRIVRGVFSHAGCSTAVRDARLSSKRGSFILHVLQAEQREQFAALARMLNLWLLMIDAPEHDRLRKLMNKGFAAPVLESLRPQIERIVDRLLERLHNAFEADLLKDVAYPLPVRVIAEMLGIADTTDERLIEWSDAIAVLFGKPNRNVDDFRVAQNAVLELTEYFRKAVADRRRQKGHDLISLLLDIEEDGDFLNDEEVYAQCVMLLFGGHETTRNLVGNGMHALLRHPREMEELRETPGIIRSAVEELLRYDSPVQFTSRTVKQEMEICGERVREGESVVFFNGAANRDPRQFKDPDGLDLKRVSNPHLAFGAGAHFCIGSQLARLEGQIAILKLAQQFPRMRLAQEKVEWASSFSLRGLKALPVAL